MKRLIPVLIMMVVLGSCSNEPTERPRPRAYHKITYPERKVVSFSSEDCPFAFEHMSYAQPQKDEAFFDEPPEHPCWFDLNMPIFNGKWHFSYHPIQDRAHFDKLVADTSTRSSLKRERMSVVSFSTWRDR
jgi:hypothetical protein